MSEDFDGVLDKASILDYVAAIREELADAVDLEITKLIVALRTSIVGSAVEIHTLLIDVRETYYARIVMTDGNHIHY